MIDCHRSVSIAGVRLGVGSAAYPRRPSGGHDPAPISQHLSPIDIVVNLEIV
jgi:hypothetical protein